MRIRTIKPEFFLHEGLVELEQSSKLPVRLAFIGLWCIADREGRFKWEPRKLGVQVFPYESVNFAEVLGALEGTGMILRYGASGEYGCIPSFLSHQCINLREAKSNLPEYTETHVHARACMEVTNEAELFVNPARGEGKGKEVEGKGNGREMEGKEFGDSAKQKNTAKAKCPEEVEAFAVSLGCPAGQGAAAYWKWEGNGWTNGKAPIKDWKATVRSWKAQGYAPFLPEAPAKAAPKSFAQIDREDKEASRYGAITIKAKVLTLEG